MFTAPFITVSRPKSVGPRPAPPCPCPAPGTPLLCSLTAPYCTTQHHTAPHSTTLHLTAPHCTTQQHGCLSTSLAWVRAWPEQLTLTRGGGPSLLELGRTHAPLPRRKDALVATSLPKKVSICYRYRFMTFGLYCRLLHLTVPVCTILVTHINKNQLPESPIIHHKIAR
jgi:hypothetical protein